MSWKIGNDLRRYRSNHHASLTIAITYMCYVVFHFPHLETGARSSMAQFSETEIQHGSERWRHMPRLTKVYCLPGEEVGAHSIRRTAGSLENSQRTVEHFSIFCSIERTAPRGRASVGTGKIRRLAYGWPDICTSSRPSATDMALRGESELDSNDVRNRPKPRAAVDSFLPVLWLRFGINLPLASLRWTIYLAAERINRALLEGGWPLSKRSARTPAADGNISMCSYHDGSIQPIAVGWSYGTKFSISARRRPYT